MADSVTQLVGVKVKTVGLVDKGANGRPIAIIKRALPFADLAILDEAPPEKTDAQLLDDILGPEGDNFAAMDDAHLWRDDEAIAARDGEVTRADYKLPIADRGSDGVLRVYYPKIVGALAALNGARGGVDIPNEDAERAFGIGVRYVRKLNDALPEDGQKEIPEFRGVQQGAGDMADKVNKQEEGELPPAEAPEAPADFPTLRAAALERLGLAQANIEALQDFSNMSKDDVQAAIWGVHDVLWSAGDDMVALAKSAGVPIAKQTELGDFLRNARDEAEITNEELAEAAGIAVGTVAGILAGDITRPPDDRLRGFASVLPGVSFQDLVDLLPAELQEERTDVTQQEAEMAEQNEDSALQKRLDEAVAKALAERDEEHAAALQKRDERIMGLEDRNRLNELVTKAKADFPSLGDPNELAKQMQVVEKASPEALEALCKSLAGAEAKAKVGLEALTKNLGRRAEPVEGSPDDILEKRLGELVADGTVDTVQKAWLHVAQTQPELINNTRQEV